VSPLSNFNTSLCLVAYDDDTICSNSSFGLISPTICLPLVIPAPKPQWTENSVAQPIAEDGTYPVFTGTVGCRSYFVAAASDLHYDIYVDHLTKLPPGVTIYSR